MQNNKLDPAMAESNKEEDMAYEYSYNFALLCYGRKLTPP